MSDLNTLAKEMVEQDNLGTQYPFWFVMEEERVPCTIFDDYDERERVEETEKDDLCYDCTELFESEQELPAECDECDSEAFNYWRNEDTINNRSGGYFTQKACQDHINENDYHYTKPRTYAYSAWRNPDLIMVMQSIITGGGYELPSHYESR